MKKTLKKFAIFLTILIGSVCLLSGCKKIQESGDFSYYVSASDKNIVIIEGLSESGKEKGMIIIPEFIDGKLVYEVGSRGFWGDSSGLNSENLETVYIQGAPYCNGYSGCPNLKKVVLRNVDIKDKRIHGYIGKPEGKVNVYICRSIQLDESAMNWANISYLYNYKSAENEGYYWVDNFDYGEKIGYIPENPVREGYIFGGWFKEAECENLWNFDKDTLPEAIYDENGEELYQETRLYAKWYKNQ